MSGLIPACQLTSNVRGFKSNDSQTSTCFSLGSSKFWLRHTCFRAYRKSARKLLMRHPVVFLGLTLHVNRCWLARVTGPVFSHGSFCLAKVNGRLREVRGGKIKSLDPLYEYQQTTNWRLFMSAALTSRANLPPMCGRAQAARYCFFLFYDSQTCVLRPATHLETPRK